MKYPAQAYAKAFIEAVEEHPAKKDKLIENFLHTVRKNGDWPLIGKVFSQIANKMTRNSGGRIITAEFARPLSEKLMAEFTRQFSVHDRVEVSIKPELIAGVRVLIDGEKELDMTLAKKINKLLL